MAVTYDPPKREWTLTNRGLDFEDAQAVFDGVTVDFEDARKDYGEPATSALVTFAGAWWRSLGPRVTGAATSSA